MNPVRCEWSIFAENNLLKALGNDKEIIKAEVKQGIAELWFFLGLGYCVTRIEGSEIVLVAGQGRQAHKVLNYFCEIGKNIGLKSMRIHSSRQGMGRYLKKLNFKVDETVYRKVF